MATTPLSPLTCKGMALVVTLVVPNWSKVFAPQAQTVPSERSARLYSPPAATATVLVIAVTWTGVLVEVTGVVVPRPSWPELLSPQAQTVPSERSARLRLSPAAIAVTLIRPVTCVGFLLGEEVTVPRPSWPSLFAPQAQTVPSERSARLCPPPAATATMPLSGGPWVWLMAVVTSTGVLVKGVVAARPSC
jgi:hypothetical protein